MTATSPKQQDSSSKNPQQSTNAELIQKSIEQSIEVKRLLLGDSHLLQSIESSARLISDSLRRGGLFLAAGNGGSASDSQHIVAELVGRFSKERPPMRAVALSANAANLTCLGNDYGYDQIFSRQVEALGQKGDVFLAITTSGRSPNILLAAKKAKSMGLQVIGLTGAGGRQGEFADLCDELIAVPSPNTPRIQESHILIGHILCEIVESAAIN